MPRLTAARSATEYINNLMDHDVCMQLAIKEARKAKHENCAPIGAAVVQNGICIASAHNQKHIRHDPTAHAEIQAIRKAAKRLGSDLDGCVLYTTVQPCLMCLSACYWAHIETVYFGVGRKVGDRYFVTSNDSRVEICEDMYNRRIQLIGGVLERECYDCFL